MKTLSTLILSEAQTTRVVSTVTQTTTGPVTTTEEVKTTTVTTPAGEELTTVTTSVPLVSTTPSYCLEPMDDLEGLEVELSTDGKSSIDETTRTWKVPVPITEDMDNKPKLCAQFSKVSAVNGIRLANVADTLGFVPVEKVEISFIVSYRRPGADEFIEVPEEETDQRVSCKFVSQVRLVWFYTRDFP